MYIPRLSSAIAADHRATARDTRPRPAQITQRCGNLGQQGYRHGVEDSCRDDDEKLTLASVPGRAGFTNHDVQSSTLRPALPPSSLLPLPSPSSSPPSRCSSFTTRIRNGYAPSHVTPAPFPSSSRALSATMTTIVLTPTPENDHKPNHHILHPRDTPGATTTMSAQNTTTGVVVGVLIAVFLAAVGYFLWRYHDSMHARRRRRRRQQQMRQRSRAYSSSSANTGTDTTGGATTTTEASSRTRGSIGWRIWPRWGGGRRRGRRGGSHRRPRGQNPGQHQRSHRKPRVSRHGWAWPWIAAAHHRSRRSRRRRQPRKRPNPPKARPKTKGQSRRQTKVPDSTWKWITGGWAWGQSAGAAGGARQNQGPPNTST
ncbi:hypothetical protein VTJ83DRAFT_1431 [Remersonia thermophila]|uniref:Transmembrane protein n=1 Tax=Remersonia thermophila TaxID=72144 RepID=A0ABR4DP03_9PEZI